LNFVYEDLEAETTKRLTFDIRYYENYAKTFDGDLEGGLYIFKSIHNTSHLFNQSVVFVNAYQGTLMSMFVIYFKSKMNPYENNFLKIKVAGDGIKFNEQIEFDLYLEGIQYMPGLDVTVNWKCWDLNATGNIFYTDANALEIVKRTSDIYSKRYHYTTQQRASSNFYPVQSGIFIEDESLGEQMVIMNDRSEGGSAWQNGTLELMINRRGNTSDSLGNDESLNETEWVNGIEVGIRVNAKYRLQFTKSRKQALDTIRKRFLRTQYPL